MIVEEVNNLPIVRITGTVKTLIVEEKIEGKLPSGISPTRWIDQAETTYLPI